MKIHTRRSSLRLGSTYTKVVCPMAGLGLTILSFATLFPIAKQALVVEAAIDPALGFIPNDSIRKDEITSVDFGEYFLSLSLSNDVLNKLCLVFNKCSF